MTKSSKNFALSNFCPTNLLNKVNFFGVEMLNCRTLGGKTTQVSFDDEMDVSTLKQILSSQISMPANSFSLFFHAQILQDNEKVANLHVKSQEFISIYPQPQKFVNNNISRNQKAQKSYKRSLPPRNDAYIPKNIDKLVQKLENLGYEHEKCRKALISASYNLERAAEYLIEDRIPEIEQFDVNKEKAFIKELIKATPSYRSKVEQPAIELTKDDIYSLRKLQEEGYEPNLAIQVFMACGRDSSITQSCLLTLA